MTSAGGTGVPMTLWAIGPGPVALNVQRDGREWAYHFQEAMKRAAPGAAQRIRWGDLDDGRRLWIVSVESPSTPSHFVLAFPPSGLSAETFLNGPGSNAEV